MAGAALYDQEQIYECGIFSVFLGYLGHISFIIEDKIENEKHSSRDDSAYKTRT